MSRGVWKLPFVEASLLKKVEKFKNNKKPLKPGLENRLSFQILLELVF